MLTKVYLSAPVGSFVYMVFTSKREGHKDNVVIKCRVKEVHILQHNIIYSCEPVKFMTKTKEDLKNYVSSFMFETANIDTGYRSGFNRYPVFTTKEKCLEWIKG